MFKKISLLLPFVLLIGISTLTPAEARSRYSSNLQDTSYTENSSYTRGNNQNTLITQTAHTTRAPHTYTSIQRDWQERCYQYAPTDFAWQERYCQHLLTNLGGGQDAFMQRSSYEQKYFPDNTTVQGHHTTQHSYAQRHAAPGYTPSYIFPHEYPFLPGNSRYPGCDAPDIRIGGQQWASCNSISQNIGSDVFSGWFLFGDVSAWYISANGAGNVLSSIEKWNIRKSWTQGPCAEGYRLPNQGEWERANLYARQNNVLVSELLRLPYNGSFFAYSDSRTGVRIEARVDVGGAYWSGTYEQGTPFILHLGSSAGGYRSDGSELSYTDDVTGLQYGRNGFELVHGQYGELANVRCIADI